MDKEKKEKKEHITHKAHTKQKRTSIYNLIGDGMGKMGKISPSGNEREQDQIDFLEKERDNIGEELAKTTQKEQQLWKDNRGYQEYTSGERCTRRFFDGMRQAMACSLIKKHSHAQEVWEPQLQKS